MLLRLTGELKESIASVAAIISFLGNFLSGLLVARAGARCCSAGQLYVWPSIHMWMCLEECHCRSSRLQYTVANIVHTDLTVSGPLNDILCLASKSCNHLKNPATRSLLSPRNVLNHLKEPMHMLQLGSSGVSQAITQNHRTERFSASRTFYGSCS